MLSKSGIDGNSAKLVKAAAQVVAPVHTFLTIFQSGSYPPALQLAKLIPVYVLYKKGDKSLTEYCRPISLLYCINKLQESV